MKIRHLFVSFALLAALQGCASISSLEQVKPHEGITQSFAAPYDKVLHAAEEAPKTAGLVPVEIKKKEGRVEILCKSEPSETDYGAFFGIFVYPETEQTVPVQIVKRKKTAASIFVRDYTQDLFQAIEKGISK